MKTKTGLMVLLFGAFCVSLLDSCATATVNLVKQNGFVIEKRNGSGYGFGSVVVYRHANRMVVSGIISVNGRYLPGHVDLAIFHPAGQIIHKGSISPSRAYRSRGRTINKSTYDFRYELPVAGINIPDGASIRVSFHESRGQMNPAFDCGKNSAL